MPMINVIEPGLQTTVQDLGRPMHQINGFPASGAMDQTALQVARQLAVCRCFRVFTDWADIAFYGDDVHCLNRS